MGKERLMAFIDAVLAIIMTILVLELEKPEGSNLFVDTIRDPFYQCRLQQRCDTGVYGIMVLLVTLPNFLQGGKRHER